MRTMIVGALLACAALGGCEPERSAPPTECTPEWISAVEDRLRISEQRLAVLEEDVTELEQARYQRDGGQPDAR